MVTTVLFAAWLGWDVEKSRETHGDSRISQDLNYPYLLFESIVISLNMLTYVVISFGLFNRHGYNGYICIHILGVQEVAPYAEDCNKITRVTWLPFFGRVFGFD